MCSSRSALVCGGLTPPSLSRLVSKASPGVSVSAIYAAVATAAPGAGVGLRWRDLSIRSPRLVRTISVIGMTLECNTLPEL